jgi:hypothetical protein
MTIKGTVSSAEHCSTPLDSLKPFGHRELFYQYTVRLKHRNEGEPLKIVKVSDLRKIHPTNSWACMVIQDSICHWVIGLWLIHTSRLALSHTHTHTDLQKLVRKPLLWAWEVVVQDNCACLGKGMEVWTSCYHARGRVSSWGEGQHRGQLAEGKGSTMELAYWSSSVPMYG